MDHLPELLTSVPGPASTSLVDVLARHECPAITARRSRRAAASGSGTDPIVWRDALRTNVWDADGNRFVDLTSGFGVALVGHRHPDIVRAATTQSQHLLHAMGDAFPDVTRIHLLEELAAIAPSGMDHAILGLSGADAVDAVVKTAVLATGRTGVLVFEGSYHGLSLGTVALQAYKDAFTDPFRAIVHPDVHVLPFGAPLERVRERLDKGDIGLVLVEPIQGRGGIRVAPDGWLEALAHAAHAVDALIGHDEIQCGLGRTGQVWAGPPPDLLAVGKALGGGFPLSAALGTHSVMAAWGDSRGEALHTQTFLGHPVGCAAGRAFLGLVRDGLALRCAERGQVLAESLHEAGFTTQGRGLMLGVPLPDTLKTSRHLLEAGYIVLPAGRQAEVLCLTPPVTISDGQIQAFVQALRKAV